MDKIAIEGGGTLNGTVSVSGAKNSALPIIFSTLLAEGEFNLTNIPHLRDIDSTRALMDSLGCKTSFEKNHLKVDVPRNLETLAHYDLVRKMRASILVLGPLLARYGKAQVSLPGGCAIGARPINFHLDAFKQMGAEINIDRGYVIASAKKLIGCEIKLPFPSVGGTENIMMAACLAEGTTQILNAAQEPEIVDHANILRAMGADITGDGTSTITIKGKSELKACDHRIIADRIEAGTFLVAGAITGGEVHITHCQPQHLSALIDKLQMAGLKIDVGNDSMTIHKSTGITPVDMSTEPYPGFPTDLQAQYMTLMTQANGDSRITENVFENRFMHVQELARMNAQIEIKGKTAIVHGERGSLVGAPVMATDLRASASLVLAGLAAKGETVISRIYHLDRGYEKLEDKLCALGGRVRRLKE